MESLRFLRFNLSANGCRLASIVLASVMLLHLPMASTESECTRELQTDNLCHNCTKENGTVVNLVHTMAQGHFDTIHFVYSSWGTPSILIAKTSNTAKLEVDYEKLLNDSVISTSDSISFTEKPENIFVVMLSQVIDFVDIKDSGVIGNLSTTYDLSKSMWKNVSISNVSRTSHTISFTTSEESVVPPLNQNGSIVITFRVLCDEGYFSELPNLQYNSNMSLADVILDNVQTVSNTSRLAIRMIVAAQGDPSKNMTINKHKAIDDEHSPGSFLTINWLTEANETAPSSFLQWKPTCYRMPVRNLQSLSSSHYNGPDRYSFEIENMTRSLAFNYFGESLVDKVRAADTFISFGLPLDGFYVSTKYDAWSFSFGFGTPPSDKISLAIIFVIAVGLGIPVLLTIGGTVYICIRRYRHREGYEEITGSYSEIN